MPTWSKLMNVETCRHVADLIVMAHAFAELRYGVVARQHENGFKCGHNFVQTLYYVLPAYPRVCAVWRVAAGCMPGARVRPGEAPHIGLNLCSLFPG